MSTLEIDLDILEKEKVIDHETRLSTDESDA